MVNQTGKVHVDTDRSRLFEVELKVAEREGIDGRIIINKVWSP